MEGAAATPTAPARTSPPESVIDQVRRGGGAARVGESAPAHVRLVRPAACAREQWQAMRTSKLSPTDNWDNVSDVLLYQANQDVRRRACAICIREWGAHVDMHSRTGHAASAVRGSVRQLPHAIVQMLRPALSVLAYFMPSVWLVQLADEKLHLHELLGQAGPMLGTQPNWAYALGLGLAGFLMVTVRAQNIISVREMWLTQKGACVRVETYNMLGVRGWGGVARVRGS